MVKKTDALVRDLAKLFTRYSLADWQPIIEGLRSSAATQEQIAAAIETLASSAKSSVSTKSLRQAPRKLALDPHFLDHLPLQRRGALEDLGAALLTKRVLPRAPDLRATYVMVGGKGSLPKERERAIATLITLLAEVTEPRFSDALQLIWRESQLPETGLKHDYARWFNIIYGSVRPDSTNS